MKTRVVWIDSHEISIWEAGRRLAVCPAGNLAALQTILAEKARWLLVLDHPREDFQFDRVPILSRADRAAYLERQLAQRFPEAQFRQAALLASGRIGYRALPTDVLPAEIAMLKIAGIYSMTLAATALLQRVPELPKSLFWQWGERLLFVQEGEVYFVRSIGLHSQAEEVQRTRQYLASSVPAALDCPLWQADAELLQRLAPNAENWPSAVLAAIGKSEISAHYVVKTTSSSFKPWQHRLAGAAILGGICILGLSGQEWLKLSAQFRADARNLQREEREVQSLLAEVSRELSVPIEVVQAARQQRQIGDVETTAQEISQIFMRYPQWVLDRFEWQTTASLPSVTMLGHTNDPAAVGRLQSELALLAKVQAEALPGGQFKLQLKMNTP